MDYWILWYLIGYYYIWVYNQYRVINSCRMKIYFSWYYDEPSKRNWILILLTNTLGSIFAILIVAGCKCTAWSCYWA